MNAKTVLEDVITNSLDADDFAIEDMAAWARKPDAPEWFRAHVTQFRAELKAALDQPGLVTPDDFENWTRVDLQSQDEVQRHLHNIWRVCFG